MENTSDTDDLPFKPSPLPAHIAIVMDGNGRWARARGKPRIFGHRAGAESVRKIVKACGKWGIGCLTLYAFSTENWKRPEDEVSSLMGLLARYLRGEVDELNNNNVRLGAIGNIQRLPEGARNELERAIELLSSNTGLRLTLALSYGARDEITRAVRTLAARVRQGELIPEDICENDIASALDTAGLPDPDLMIRTAGEMRLSNFLLWQASYAEYFSTPVCWPDFDEAELAKAVLAFQSRTRKFGAVVE